jgi:2-polyprenyl-6-methoxyphenol hydroxylase-like FAD-dependent oxidoreductase
MVETARSAAVELLWETVVTGVDGSRVHLSNGSASARWIVGADGGQSLVRKWAGLDVCARESHRFGSRRHCHVVPWSDHVEVYWGSGFQIYVTPVAPDEVCFALISRNPRMRLEHALPQFPELAARLAGAGISSTDRGATSVTRGLNKVWRGNVALIGDASGSVDAVTGEGLCLAFQQAHALADAFEASNLATYQSAHDRLLQRPRMMSNLLLLLDRLPVLRRRVLKAFSRKPELFSRMLAAHVGAGRLADLASAGIALGAEIL